MDKVTKLCLEMLTKKYDTCFDKTMIASEVMTRKTSRSFH